MNLSSEKLKGLVHYIVERAQDPWKLGTVRLNKILCYADRIWFAEHGESITGTTYVRKPRHDGHVSCQYSVSVV